MLTGGHQAPPPGVLEFRCLIPAAASGIVIGRGGAIVKEIGDATRTSIKLSDNRDLAFTSERLVSVRGTILQNVIAVCYNITNALIQSEASPTLVFLGCRL